MCVDGAFVLVRCVDVCGRMLCGTPVQPALPVFGQLESLVVCIHFVETVVLGIRSKSWGRPFFFFRCAMGEMNDAVA